MYLCREFVQLLDFREYTLCSVAEDAAGNLQGSATSRRFSTRDDAAPIITASLVEGSLLTVPATGTCQATLTISVNEAANVTVIAAPAPAANGVPALASVTASAVLDSTATVVAEYGGVFRVLPQLLTNQEQGVTFSALPCAAQVTAVIAARDVSGNIAEPPTVLTFATPDVLAPVFTLSTPAVVTVDAAESTVTVALDEAGIVWCIVEACAYLGDAYCALSVLPSVAQVLAGQGVDERPVAAQASVSVPAAKQPANMTLGVRQVCSGCTILFRVALCACIGGRCFVTAFY